MNVIGTLLRWDLAPMDYRYALDAVMPLLPTEGPTLVRCDVPTLAAEVRQRLSRSTDWGSARTALWVEPMARDWQSELELLSAALEAASVLCVVASRPAARLLPERREWPGEPLGLQLAGLSRLCRALGNQGFVVADEYGLHSVVAVVLNLLGGLVTRLGRPDLGDRLGATARLCYCTAGRTAPLSTVALLVARRLGS